jgi:rhodanese-related sulfurtransferase
MARTISAGELAELCRSGKPIDLIDVRTPAEFEGAHVDRARNVPLERLDQAAIERERIGRADEPVYVICQKGGRGQQACEKLAASGLANVVNVAGGTDACDVAGMRLVYGRKTMSLERQVRIAAGSLVLVASVLGYFVSPYWIGLAAFIGAGLVFAGVTDTCGMGLLLARMPWNQRGGAADSCAVSNRRNQQTSTS